VNIVFEYGNNQLGKNVKIFDPVTLGFPSRDYIGKKNHPGVIIGDNAIIRSGTILYADVRTGSNFSTGHNAVREKTYWGIMSLLDRVIIEATARLGPCQSSIGGWTVN
jgi:acetyltransferase-like isoleucine patch superfamily enzyme